ncbi:MAG: hypothetical protein IJW48_02385 [Clostridia bacterium]|nr:hypothetical protein [Clostridia bacterium]
MPISDAVGALSYCVHQPHGEKPELLFPASTRFKNKFGGTAVVFAGNLDTLQLLFRFLLPYRNEKAGIHSILFTRR